MNATDKVGMQRMNKFALRMISVAVLFALPLYLVAMAVAIS